MTRTGVQRMTQLNLPMICRTDGSWKT